MNEEEVASGLQMIQEDPYLQNDGYARKVVEAGGVVDNGKSVDIGDFLAARRAVLEMWQAEDKVAAAKDKNQDAYDAAVINSVRPDLEAK